MFKKSLALLAFISAASAVETTEASWISSLFGISHAEVRQ